MTKKYSIEAGLRRQFAGYTPDGMVGVLYFLGEAADHTDPAESPRKFAEILREMRAYIKQIKAET